MLELSWYLVFDVYVIRLVELNIVLNSVKL